MLLMTDWQGTVFKTDKKFKSVRMKCECILCRSFGIAGYKWWFKSVLQLEDEHLQYRSNICRCCCCFTWTEMPWIETLVEFISTLMAQKVAYYTEFYYEWYFQCSSALWSKLCVGKLQAVSHCGCGCACMQCVVLSHTLYSSSYIQCTVFCHW